jgi:hypothetical protein
VIDRAGTAGRERKTNPKIIETTDEFALAWLRL